MKRIFALILCVCSIFAICGCAQKPIKEYKGTPVVSLTYETVDYMGGYTEVYLFDFEENTVKRRAYLPSELEGENAPVQVIRQFTEEEEKRLIDKLYTYGLFGIKENYRSPAGISDGGGWSLALAFGDGTVKKSKGSNNAPHKVFENCAKAFYDICQTGIVASVPTEYYCPPNLSYTFHS